MSLRMYCKISGRRYHTKWAHKKQFIYVHHVHIRNIYSYNLVHRQCMGVTRSYHTEYQRWTAGCVLAWPESACMHRSLLQSSSTAASALWPQILLILGALGGSQVQKEGRRKCRIGIAHSSWCTQQSIHSIATFATALVNSAWFGGLVGPYMWSKNYETLRDYEVISGERKFRVPLGKIQLEGFQWDGVRFGTGDIHIYSIEVL